MPPVSPVTTSIVCKGFSAVKEYILYINHLNKL